MLSYIQILTISIGVLYIAVIALLWYYIRVARIISAVRKNVHIVETPRTPEMVNYLIQQRDKHHWSHPKYKAYNDRLIEIGN